GLERGTTRGQLLVRDQDVGRTLVEVNADAVTGLEQRQTAAGGGFRRGVQDRRRARRARLAAIANAGQRKDAALDEGCRRLHVHDLGSARIADRTGAADEQDAVLVDVELRIV